MSDPGIDRLRSVLETTRATLAAVRKIVVELEQQGQALRAEVKEWRTKALDVATHPIVVILRAELEAARAETKRLRGFFGKHCARDEDCIVCGHRTGEHLSEGDVYCTIGGCACERFEVILAWTLRARESGAQLEAAKKERDEAKRERAELETEYLDYCEESSATAASWRNRGDALESQLAAARQREERLQASLRSASVALNVCQGWLRGLGRLKESDDADRWRDEAYDAALAVPAPDKEKP